MGYNFTGDLAVDGTDNLLALLVAAGYQGPAKLANEATLYNGDPAVACYIHFTNSNTTAPSTGTDGLPVLVDAPSNAFTLPKGTDLSTTWLHSASAIDVRVGFIG